MPSGDRIFSSKSVLSDNPIDLKKKLHGRNKLHIIVNKTGVGIKSFILHSVSNKLYLLFIGLFGICVECQINVLSDKSGNKVQTVVNFQR